MRTLACNTCGRSSAVTYALRLQTQISVCVLQSVTEESLVSERFWHKGISRSFKPICQKRSLTRDSFQHRRLLQTALCIVTAAVTVTYGNASFVVAGFYSSVRLLPLTQGCLLAAAGPCCIRHCVTVLRRARQPAENPPGFAKWLILPTVGAPLKSALCRFLKGAKPPSEIRALVGSQSKVVQ